MVGNESNSSQLFLSVQGGILPPLKAVEVLILSTVTLTLFGNGVFSDVSSSDEVFGQTVIQCNWCSCKKRSRGTETDLHRRKVA